MLFTEWFHQCFNPEVQESLEKERLALKVLLIIDNAPGHPQSISIEDGEVEVALLSPNTTSLLHPLDPVTIRCVKTSYTRQVFEMFRVATDADLNLQVMSFWKSFTIPDAITLIEAAMDELNPERVNALWKN